MINGKRVEIQFGRRVTSRVFLFQSNKHKTHILKIFISFLFINCVSFVRHYFQLELKKESPHAQRQRAPPCTFNAPRVRNPTSFVTVYAVQHHHTNTPFRSRPRLRDREYNNTGEETQKCFRFVLFFFVARAPSR